LYVTVVSPLKIVENEIICENINSTTQKKHLAFDLERTIHILKYFQKPWFEHQSHQPSLKSYLSLHDIALTDNGLYIVPINSVVAYDISIASVEHIKMIRKNRHPIAETKETL
jgi:hypothetical protein